MENNFYVGIVHHEKGLISDGYNEKVVLYSDNNIYYIDLLKQKTYSTNREEKEYVLEDTLISTDVNDFNINYMYLLNKYRNYGRDIKKKNKINIFNKK